MSRSSASLCTLRERHTKAVIGGALLVGGADEGFLCAARRREMRCDEDDKENELHQCDGVRPLAWSAMSAHVIGR